MSEPVPYPTEALPLDELHLDPLNPRLPEDMQGKPELELLRYIAKHYNAIEVAISITQFGFFPSEPLIAIKTANGYIVVEGNRRLAALRLLFDPSAAEGLDEETTWKSLSRKVRLPSTIPVVVAPDREAVAPIIGFRHISGIQPWDPYAKARFIARLVKDGMSFEDVASVVGERTVDVATFYRNHQIVVQAKEDFKIDTRLVEGAFGVFTRAMSSNPIRKFIGAPTPKDMRPDSVVVQASKSKNLKELFSWVFGDDKNSPVIGESRDITQLGRVLDSKSALSVLRTTRDLEEADLAAYGPLERLTRRLNLARSNLSAATTDMQAYSDDSKVREILKDIVELVNKLSAVSAHD